MKKTKIKKGILSIPPLFRLLHNGGCNINVNLNVNNTPRLKWWQKTLV